MDLLLATSSRLISQKLESAGGRGLHVIHGLRGLSRWALEALCPLLDPSRTVYWVDAANRFNAHALSKRARELGMDPRAVLSRIRLARAFNGFQLTTLVRGVARFPPSPVVLADPLAPFYDEDFPFEDARRAFGEFLSGLADVPGPVLALVADRPAPPQREDFSPRLLKMARSVTPVECPMLES
jgi:hypothetical protein